MFSGQYYTYLANTVQVHCYLRTIMDLECFTDHPAFIDKCSGDD